jgi:hypothetical protein
LRIRPRLALRPDARPFPVFRAKRRLRLYRRRLQSAGSPACLCRRESRRIK